MEEEALAASKAPLEEVAALDRFHPRHLAAASQSEPLRDMPEGISMVSGRILCFPTSVSFLSLLTPGRVGHGPFTGGASGRSSIEQPPADCIVAKAVNKQLKPKVDCFYSWEHWHKDNFLFYVIRITPNGQNSKGWAKGVRDNIKGEVSPPPSPLPKRRHGGIYCILTWTKVRPRSYRVLVVGE